MTKIAKKTTISVKKVKVKNGIQAKVKKDASPLPKPTVNAEQECPKHQLKPRAVTTGVHALLEVIKLRQNEEKKKTLFKNDPKAIMLQIVPIKVPITPMQQIRVVLPHPLSIEGSDVCLITQNVKKATKDDHGPTIAYYKSLLQEKEIKGITEIVPIRQLRSEHVPYEMKGRFADMYDMFLVDGRLFGKVTKYLGTQFFKRNKDLIPVKINTNNVKEELEKALAKTVLTVHGHGDNFSVRVGFSTFTTEQLEANILAVADVIAKSFPGGFVNIRKLLIKSERSMSIPIYLSLTPHNSVPVPTVAPHLPKAYVPVEDELSTYVGKLVTVMPTGEVELRDMVTAEDVDMGFNFGLPVTVVDEEEVVPKAGKKRKMAAAADSSDDEDVEAAEDAYVLNLQRAQANSVVKAQSQEAKVLPKAKKQASQGETEGGELQRNQSLQVGNRVAVDKTQDVVGLKRKKAPKLKKQPEPEEESEMIEVKSKKLKASPKIKSGKLNATPKVEPLKIKKQPESELIEMKSKKLRATPKIQSGKVKKEVSEMMGVKRKKLNATPADSEMEEDSGVTGLRSKSLKAMIEEDAQVNGSPNKSGKSLKVVNSPNKEEFDVSKGRSPKARQHAASMKQPEEHTTQPTLGVTRKMTRPFDATDTVMEQKKTPKVPKKNPNRESSRLVILKHSKFDNLESKEIKHSNEVDFPAQSKLDMDAFNTPVFEKSTAKKKKKGDKRATNVNDTSTNSILHVETSGSLEVLTNTDEKKKWDKRSSIGDDAVHAVMSSLDFGSPSIETNTEKKKKKRDKLAMNVQDATPERPSLSLACMCVPPCGTHTGKKIELDKLATNDKDARPLLSLDSPARETNTEKKKKKRDKRERASVGEETSPHSMLPLNAMKKIKKADLHAGTPAMDRLITIEIVDGGAAWKTKPTPAATRVQPTRSKKEVPEVCDMVVKEKAEKIKKRKEKSTTSAELEESATTPTPKKKKNKKRDSSGDLATPLNRMILTTIKEQTRLSSQDLSKSKDEAKDKKVNKKSKTEQKSAKVVQVRKSFPRYFSMENQQALAEYDTTNAPNKRREPKNERAERINIGEAMPHYIPMAGKSDIASLLADAKDRGESVVTMPMDLVLELQKRKDEQRKRHARKQAAPTGRDYLRLREEREKEPRGNRAEEKARRIRECYFELREKNLRAEKTVPEWMPRERDRSYPKYNAELRREIAREYFHLRRKNEQKLLSTLSQSNSG